jgi:hypothetical protein
MMHFALCKEQEHSQKQDFFVIMVQLKLLRVFKPAGLTVCIFFSLSVHFVCSSVVFRGSFCTHEGTLPYRSSAQMSCRDKVGVSFLVLGVLEPQIACHYFRSAAISRH